MQKVLTACGRSHSLTDVHKAIADVKSAGVTNWSLDLISGLPHTSLESWQYSLGQAVAAGPSHISVYDLQVLKIPQICKVFWSLHSQITKNLVSAF